MFKERNQFFIGCSKAGIVLTFITYFLWAYDVIGINWVTGFVMAAVSFFILSLIFPPRLYFTRLRETAIIPSKRREDLGYDIYACFDEPFIKLNAHETKMIPTGIASTMSEEYGVILKERGSTGSRGMGIRAGVIDSGYKDEWFVALTNHNKKPIYICKKEYEEDLRAKFKTEIDVYPYEKAICQAVVVRNYGLKTKEITKEKLYRIKSDRGEGKLGSSGK